MLLRRNPCSEYKSHIFWARTVTKAISFLQARFFQLKHEIAILYGFCRYFRLDLLDSHCIVSLILLTSSILVLDPAYPSIVILTQRSANTYPPVRKETMSMPLSATWCRTWWEIWQLLVGLPAILNLHIYCSMIGKLGFKMWVPINETGLVLRTRMIEKLWKKSQWCIWTKSRPQNQ